MSYLAILRVYMTIGDGSKRGHSLNRLVVGFSGVSSSWYKKSRFGWLLLSGMGADRVFFIAHLFWQRW